MVKNIFNMELIHSETIRIFTSKINNKSKNEQSTYSIIYNAKQLIKKIYISRLIEGKKIVSYINEVIKKIETTTPNSKNHQELLKMYKQNLETILNENIFNYISEIEIEDAIINLKKQIDELNKTHVLRLNEIINNGEISEQDLSLALTLLYEPEIFNLEYEKMKQQNEKKQTIIHLTTILSNLENDKKEYDLQIQKIIERKQEEQNNHRPPIYKIILLIKYYKKNKKIKNKIKIEISRLKKLLEDENTKEEDKMLKYTYCGTEIKKMLTKLHVKCENMNIKELIRTKKELINEYELTIINLKETITKMEKDIKPVHIENTFYKEKIEALLKNKPNNYIAYINKFISTLPDENTKKTLFITIILILNLINNMDTYLDEIIEKISVKEYDMILFNTFYNNHLGEKDLETAITTQNKILGNLLNINHIQKKQK